VFGNIVNTFMKVIYDVCSKSLQEEGFEPPRISPTHLECVALTKLGNSCDMLFRKHITRFLTTIHN
jgi:hypothetical protein